MVLWDAAKNIQPLLVYSRQGYFESANCMREILRAVVTGKPMIALLELEKNNAKLTEEEIREALMSCDAPCTKGTQTYSSKYNMWGLDKEVESWGYHMPDGTAIFDALFEEDPIEWARIGAFRARQSGPTPVLSCALPMCRVRSMITQRM